MKKTIAIDFDGVIHKYSKGWHDGTCYDEPCEGAAEALTYLLDNYTVFILSTREPTQIEAWFHDKLPNFLTEIIPLDSVIQFWDKPTLGITQRKLPAIAYIDDRALRFSNWTDIKNYF